MESELEPHTPSPVVDIAFDCLPLRTVSRFDVPLDASEPLRRRVEHIKACIDNLGAERSYFLFNTRCIFHFANSEVEGVCRFRFEGAVQTDAGDRKCVRSQLEVRLISETCGGLPPGVEAWLADRVRQAAAIEFDRYIAAGQLSSQSAESPEVRELRQLGGIGGLGV